MSKIQLLDCTLRDGGYVVDTIFGDYTIKGVISKLDNAKIDIIEIGYVKNCQRKEGSTTFGSMDEIKEYLPPNKSSNTKYAMMIEYNMFDLQNLIPAKESCIDIIRICYFKNDRFNVIKYAQAMMQAGYEVFMQPMDTLGYTDFEMLEMIQEINKLNPKALYIVDSYGSMYTEDLDRMYSLMNHNLKPEISIGLHSHNNLQLSFMLVQRIIELGQENRNIIVDSSCCGIGRGAGNANTELIVDYLIRKKNKNYDINEILDILDTYILKIQQEHSWGYSVPYFISGMYSVHVNNISYLLNKHNLKAKDMRIIISNIDKNSDKRYDYEKLEADLLNYFSNKIDDEQNINDLKIKLSNRKVLLLAPGNSVIKEAEKIKEYIIQNNPIVININSVIQGFKADYLFYSNVLRYDYSKANYTDIFDRTPKIVTSNIKTESRSNECVVNYNNIIKRGWKYFDNSTIMCLHLLSKLTVKEIAIAGFDGYDIINEASENYIDNNILINLSLEDKKLLNKELKEMLMDFETTNSNISIKFITLSQLVKQKELIKNL